MLLDVALELGEVCRRLGEGRIPPINPVAGNYFESKGSWIPCRSEMAGAMAEAGVAMADPEVSAPFTTANPLRTAAINKILRIRSWREEARLLTPSSLSGVYPGLHAPQHMKYFNSVGGSPTPTCAAAAAAGSRGQVDGSERGENPSAGPPRAVEAIPRHSQYSSISNRTGDITMSSQDGLAPPIVLPVPQRTPDKQAELPSVGPRILRVPHRPSVGGVGESQPPASSTIVEVAPVPPPPPTPPPYCVRTSSSVSSDGNRHPHPRKQENYSDLGFCFSCASVGSGLVVAGRSNGTVVVMGRENRAVVFDGPICPLRMYSVQPPLGDGLPPAAAFRRQASTSTSCQPVERILIHGDVIMVQQGTAVTLLDPLGDCRGLQLPSAGVETPQLGGGKAVFSPWLLGCFGPYMLVCWSRSTRSAASVEEPLLPYAVCLPSEDHPDSSPVYSFPLLDAAAAQKIEWLGGSGSVSSGSDEGRIADAVLSVAAAGENEGALLQFCPLLPGGSRPQAQPADDTKESLLLCFGMKNGVVVVLQLFDWPVPPASSLTPASGCNRHNPIHLQKMSPPQHRVLAVVAPPMELPPQELRVTAMDITAAGVLAVLRQGGTVDVWDVQRPEKTLYIIRPSTPVDTRVEAEAPAAPRNTSKRLSDQLASPPVGCICLSPRITGVALSVGCGQRVRNYHLFVPPTLAFDDEDMQVDEFAVISDEVSVSPEIVQAYPEEFPYFLRRETTLTVGCSLRAIVGHWRCLLLLYEAASCIGVLAPPAHYAVPEREWWRLMPSPFEILDANREYIEAPDEFDDLRGLANPDWIRTALIKRRAREVHSSIARAPTADASLRNHRKTPPALEIPQEDPESLQEDVAPSELQGAAVDTFWNRGWAVETLAPWTIESSTLLRESAPRLFPCFCPQTSNGDGTTLPTKGKWSPRSPLEIIWFEGGSRKKLAV